MYKFIVIDSIFHFEKDGQYAGYTDVNGLAYKQKAIRDDNIAGEVLTSLLELVSAIFLPFAAGAAIGKLAAGAGRIASFINKVSSTTARIVSTTNTAINAIKNPILKYGIQTFGRSTFKAATDIAKAGAIGIPTRIAKGDNIKDTLKNYGIALLGAFSARALGSFAYDIFLSKRAGINITKLVDKSFRDKIIKEYGIKSIIQNKITKIAEEAREVSVLKDIEPIEGRKLIKRYFRSKLKITDQDLYNYQNTTSDIYGIYDQVRDVSELKNLSFLNSQLADDVVRAILKGTEKISFIAISKNLTKVLKKFIFAKFIFGVQKNKYTNRLLILFKRLTKKKNEIIKKIELSLKRIKDKFFEKFNLKKIKYLFDKEELKKYKRIKEATNIKNRQGLSEKEQIAKLAEADEFLLKNQKLIPFQEGKGEGQFGSNWLLGYKWIAKYNNITKELEETGSLRVFFRANYPKSKYRTAKDREGKTKKFERSIFKAAITFKEVPFAMYQDFIESESQGSYYWNNFAKQRKGKQGWKPRTNTDIDWLIGQQNYSELYGLEIKGLSANITTKLLSYNKAGQNILKYQGKTKEILNFIRKPTSLVKTNLNSIIKSISRK